MAARLPVVLVRDIKNQLAEGATTSPEGAQENRSPESRMAGYIPRRRRTSLVRPSRRQRAVSPRRRPNCGGGRGASCWGSSTPTCRRRRSTTPGCGRWRPIVFSLCREAPSFRLIKQLNLGKAPVTCPSPPPPPSPRIRTRQNSKRISKMQD